MATCFLLEILTCFLEWIHLTLNSIVNIQGDHSSEFPSWPSPPLIPVTHKTYKKEGLRPVTQNTRGTQNNSKIKITAQGYGRVWA